jgi:hypothetical protein
MATQVQNRFNYVIDYTEIWMRVKDSNESNQVQDNLFLLKNWITNHGGYTRQFKYFPAPPCPFYKPHKHRKCRRKCQRDNGTIAYVQKREIKNYDGFLSGCPYHRRENPMESKKKKLHSGFTLLDVGKSLKFISSAVERLVISLDEMKHEGIKLIPDITPELKTRLNEIMKSTNMEKQYKENLKSDLSPISEIESENKHDIIMMSESDINLYEKAAQQEKKSANDLQVIIDQTRKESTKISFILMTEEAKIKNMEEGQDKIIANNKLNILREDLKKLQEKESEIEYQKLNLIDVSKSRENEILRLRKARSDIKSTPSAEVQQNTRREKQNKNVKTTRGEIVTNRRQQEIRQELKTKTNQEGALESSFSSEASKLIEEQYDIAELEKRKKELIENIEFEKQREKESHETVLKSQEQAIASQKLVTEFETKMLNTDKSERDFYVKQMDTIRQEEEKASIRLEKFEQKEELHAENAMEAGKEVQIIDKRIKTVRRRQSVSENQVPKEETLDTIKKEVTTMEKGMSTEFTVTDDRTNIIQLDDDAIDKFDNSTPTNTLIDQKTSSGTLLSSVNVLLPQIKDLRKRVITLLTYSIDNDLKDRLNALYSSSVDEEKKLKVQKIDLEAHVKTLDDLLKNKKKKKERS